MRSRTPIPLKPASNLGLENPKMFLNKMNLLQQRVYWVQWEKLCQQNVIISIRRFSSFRWEVKNSLFFKTYKSHFFLFLYTTTNFINISDFSSNSDHFWPITDHFDQFIEQFSTILTLFDHFPPIFDQNWNNFTKITFLFQLQRFLSTLIWPLFNFFFYFLYIFVFIKNNFCL